MQQDSTNQSDEHRNLFRLPKDVFCCEHQDQKIESINLSINCQHRLYCRLCKKPQDEFIFKYHDIFKKLWPAPYYKIYYGRMATEFEIVKKILLSQISDMLLSLQQLHNTYQVNFKANLIEDLTYPQRKLNYQRLEEISEELSQTLYIKNDSFSFIPEVSKEHDDLYCRLYECKTLFEKCIFQVENISPYPKHQTIGLTQSRDFSGTNISDIHNPLYVLVSEQRIELEINAFEFHYDGKYLAIAGIKNQIQHVIEIWDIDKLTHQISKQLQVLHGHESKIQHMKNDAFNLLSIDELQVIIFWQKSTNTRQWIFGRKFKAEMQQINCTQFDFSKYLLVLGGDYLQLWKLNNSEQQHTINLIEPNSINNDGIINCLSLNENGQKLVVCDTNSLVYVFEEINDQWQLIENINCQLKQIKFIAFNSQHDFISVSLGNALTKYIYDSETGYEYVIEQPIDNIENAIYIKEKRLFINPVFLKKDMEQLKPCQKRSYACWGLLLVISDNNNLRVYFACPNI